jgi:thiol-disulfide isomerase/thioredoxin
MKPVRVAWLLTVVAFLPGRAARGGEAWYREFEEARAAALAERKDLLIDFGGSDWCLPCARLKEQVLSRPEFVERASREFILVDIDRPMTKRNPIPADRDERYAKLQERYGIATFPTVVLAMSDGQPYARATYREAHRSPESYWEHLAPLRARGRRLREALARAESLEGRARAEALAEGLAEVDARFVPSFYQDRVEDLKKADPSDSTGYLAFLQGRQSLEEYQNGLDLFQGAIDPSAVEALIARNKLRGETLQAALVLRAAGEVLAGNDRQALTTFAAVLGAQSTRTRFDRGDLIPLDAASIAAVRRRIADGEADPGTGVARLYALHRIFAFDLPNPYEDSCGSGFRADIRVREAMGDRYGRALLHTTERLEGPARARALAKDLEGTFFAAQGSIREIVQALIPRLVGKAEAKSLLAGTFYARWID